MRVARRLEREGNSKGYLTRLDETQGEDDKTSYVTIWDEEGSPGTVNDNFVTLPDTVSGKV